MARGKSPYTEYTRRLMAALTLPPKKREVKYVPSPETFGKRVTDRVNQILRRLPATSSAHRKVRVATDGSIEAEPLTYPTGAPNRKAGDRELDARARASAENAAPLRSLGDRVRAWARTADTNAMLMGPGATNYAWLGVVYEGLTGGNPMHNDAKRKQFASELRRAWQAGDLMCWSYYKLVRLRRVEEGAPSELILASRMTWPGQTMHLVEVERLFMRQESPALVEKYERVLEQRSKRQPRPEDPHHEGEHERAERQADEINREVSEATGVGMQDGTVHRGEAGIEEPSGVLVYAGKRES